MNNLNKVILIFSYKLHPRFLASLFLQFELADRSFLQVLALVINKVKIFVKFLNDELKIPDKMEFVFFCSIKAILFAQLLTQSYILLLYRIVLFLQFKQFSILLIQKLLLLIHSVSHELFFFRKSSQLLLLLEILVCVLFETIMAFYMR